MNRPNAIELAETLLEDLNSTMTAYDVAGNVAASTSPVFTCVNHGIYKHQVPDLKVKGLDRKTQKLIVLRLVSALLKSSDEDYDEFMDAFNWLQE